MQDTFCNHHRHLSSYLSNDPAKFDFSIHHLFKTKQYTVQSAEKQSLFMVSDFCTYSGFVRSVSRPCNPVQQMIQWSRNVQLKQDSNLLSCSSARVKVQIPCVRPSQRLHKHPISLCDVTSDLPISASGRRAADFLSVLDDIAGYQKVILNRGNIYW